MKAFRLTVMALTVAGVLLVPAFTLAKSQPTVYYASGLRKKATCKSSGISGPTGKVQLFVYALKQKRPSRSAVSCSRAIAVGKAGTKYMFAQVNKSYGKSFSVRGTRYRVEEFIFPAASGPAPGFVGAGTVVAAQYPSGG